MTLGLKRGTVALCDHDPEWEAEARRTIGQLRAILGDIALDLQHVGSTSVKTIKAKPIVDIAVAVRDFDQVPEKRASLEDAGFYYRPSGEDLPDQLLFARGSLYDGTGDEQTHFIHLVKADGKPWRDYLNFRDYLNANPSVAAEYESLKVHLATKCPVDAGRTHYLAGKQDFIVSTLRDALVWSFLGKRVHVVIDRPIGYVHEKPGCSIIYPVNYGYIPGVIGGDGEELDVYLLGVREPVSEADCRVIGIVHRLNDVEDKLVAAPEDVSFTFDEIAESVRFQEQWYDTRIEVLT